MIKWRYYYKKDGEVISSDEAPQDIPLNTPKLSFASLSSGRDETEIKATINAFANSGCLIRVPVFQDKSGKESEAQNQDYNLCPAPAEGGYMIGVAPKQGAEIITSSIIDGFDILPTVGGLGFCEYIPYIHEYISKNPQEFIGKKKVRLFGFSNTSNGIMLKDVLQYIHMPASFRIANALRNNSADQNILDAFAIIKGEDVSCKRVAIPHNDYAKSMCEQAETSLNITCYPFNISTSFIHYANSIWPFTAPRDKDYSLMLENIIWYPIEFTERELIPLRNFLQDLKNRGQKLPAMIEIGDLTPAAFRGPNFIYEHGLLLTASELREKFGEEKYNNFKKIIAQKLKKDLQNLTDQEADNFVTNNVNNRCKKFSEEITKIANDFAIPVFVGGEKRIGHGFHNIVTPSGSENICELKSAEGKKYFAITSKSQAITPIINQESIDNFLASKRRVERCALEPQEISKEDESAKLELFALTKLTEESEIDKIPTSIMSDPFSCARASAHDSAKCYVINYTKERDESALAREALTALEASLFIGKLGKADNVTEEFVHNVPAIIFAITDYEKALDEKKFQEQRQKISEVVKKFADYHKLEVPIFITAKPLNIEHDFSFLTKDRKINTVFKLPLKLEKAKPLTSPALHGVEHVEKAISAGAHHHQ